jgi:16S rRNA (cytosine967-C5)-methyltransferase
VPAADPPAAEPIVAEPAVPRGSLAYALLGAAALIAAVEQGESLATAQPRLAQRWQPAAADRGAIQAITFHALRWLGTARALRQTLVPRPPKPPLLRAMLDTALALAWPDDAAPYAPHVLVDQTVRALRSQADMRHAAGLANAVLRRLLREREALRGAPALRTLEAQWNFPHWWVARLQAAYPQDWQAILRAGNARAPMTLRVNARKTTREAALAALQAQGIGAALVGRSGLVLERPVPVERLPGFAEGACSVQDWGAQLAAELLDVRDRQRVLDACAAPGGKTGHILELADVELLALDSDAARLARVAQNLQRLQLAAQLCAADAAQPASWWDGRPFDRILLDAPCSASGVVRRHPDIRWLRRDGDIATLAAQQARLLDALWPLLAPGGRLVYCTCSVFPDEGERQTTAFAARTPAARRVPLNLGQNVERLQRSGQLLPDDGAAFPHDGFYYAIFERI